MADRAEWEGNYILLPITTVNLTVANHDTTWYAYDALNTYKKIDVLGYLNSSY
ncbi:MAG: hypothetical protein WCO98_00935 [bacterium]